MSQRSNLKIKVGSYAGNGTANRLISGVGFHATLILIHATTTSDCTFWIQESTPGALPRLPGATDSTVRLQAYSDGFSVDANALVNSVGVTYHYVAMKGNRNTLTTGSYWGDSTNRVFTDTNKIPFTPSVVFIKASTTNTSTVFRTPVSVGNDSCNTAGSCGSGLIQSIVANGFGVGASSYVNTTGNRYWYWAFPELPNTVFASGSYTGTGATKTITGLNFKPDYLMVKTISASAYSVVATSTMPAGNARPINGVAMGTGYIDSLNSDGFTLGTDSRVNANGTTYQWYAFKAGEFIVPVTRQS